MKYKSSFSDAIVQRLLKIFNSFPNKSERTAIKQLENLQKSTAVYKPPRKILETFESGNFDGMDYYYKKGTTKKLVIYLHGGSFVFEPLIFHWFFINKLMANTGASVIVPIYPKAPKSNAEKSINKVFELYKKALENFDGEIIVMGDSAGGTISLGLSMMIRDAKLKAPTKVILICPCIDMSLKNPKIKELQKKDFMINADETRVYLSAWLDDAKQRNPYSNPIYGDFTNLGELHLFIGTWDILYADCVKFVKKALRQGVKVFNFVYEEKTHCFPLYPTKSGDDASKIIFNIINGIEN